MNIKDFTPKSVNEAIDYLYNNITEEERKFILSEKNHGLIHHGAGTALRNGWGLWEKDTPFKKDVKERFNLFGHGDDCSGLIFEGLWAKVKGKDVDEALNKAATRYYNHWKKCGLNPETGEEVKGFKRDKSFVIEIPEDEDEE